MPQSEKFKPQAGWVEGSFRGFDGAELFFRIFTPAKLPRHTVVILHGYGEHIGRYVKFAEKLKGAPARLALFDFRGMGNSVRAPEARATEEYSKDLDCFLEHLREREGIRDKIVLLGHSMGGLVAVDWALTHPMAIKRLILSSPFLGLRGLPLCRALNAVVRLIVPGYVYRNPVMPRHLSHDPAEVAAYQKDPLIKRAISARFIGSIMDRIVWLRKKETLTMAFPVHVLAAGEERIVDPKAARKFFDRLVAPSKEFTRFDGFYHEIFNETGQDRVFNVLKTILEECV